MNALAAMARVQARPVPDAARPALAGVTFADAYARDDAPAAITAHAAARAVFDAPPHPVVSALMRLRHQIVRPLGLKTDEVLTPSASEQARMGPFPVIEVTPRRVVLGLDDKHLDFRIVLQVDALAASSRVTLTTLVQEHNALGRGYLAVVKPFHRLIVRGMLARAKFR